PSTVKCSTTRCEGNSAEGMEVLLGLEQNSSQDAPLFLFLQPRQTYRPRNERSVRIQFVGPRRRWRFSSWTHHIFTSGCIEFVGVVPVPHTQRQRRLCNAMQVHP